MIRGKFNNASARERLLFWYLSLFVMWKAWHQYNEALKSARIVELASALTGVEVGVTPIILSGTISKVLFAIILTS